MYLLSITKDLLLCGFAIQEYLQCHSDFKSGRWLRIYYSTTKHVISVTIRQPRHMINSSAITAVVRLLLGSIKSSFY